MSDFFSNRQVLVTGGGGFLGSHFCDRLAAEGCRPFVPHQADYDLTTKDGVERLIRDAEPDLVIHLAARVGGIGANQRNPGAYFFDNLMMGALLMERSRLRGRREVRAARHGLLLSEVHPRSVSRGEPVGRIPGRDQCSVRGRQESLAGAGAVVPASSTAST